MTALDVHLLGKFRATADGRDLAGLEGAKVQELFCYLLLHRTRPHPREVLAGLLWGDCTTARARKYLRQALWHLQTALHDQLPPTTAGMLQTDGDWVRLDAGETLRLDIATFERAFALTRSVPGKELTPAGHDALRGAAALYRGDLLEGWYQDWCIADRERLQAIYLLMLNKLMVASEARRDFDAGLLYGTEILRIDRARENTHRQLMRLHYLAGDRTAAIRQYQRCVAALSEDLGVGPAAATVALYNLMRTGELDEREAAAALPVANRDDAPALADVFNQLLHLRGLIEDLQARVHQQLQPGELAIEPPPAT